jgi:microtubule-associated protein tau
LIVKEETVGHQASMGSPVEMESRRDSRIVASSVTCEEKEVPIKKMWVSLAPPPNLKARGAKVMSQSSPCHRLGGGYVKINNKKLDYSKVKAKVDTWRR